MKIDRANPLHAKIAVEAILKVTDDPETAVLAFGAFLFDEDIEDLRKEVKKLCKKENKSDK